MSLSKMQEKLERSIYEQVRLVCVANGYTPDLADTVKYPDLTLPAAQALYETELATIRNTKGFAIELLNNAQTKGTKSLPKITIITRRALAGDIGSPMDGTIITHPTDPTQYAKMQVPYEASRFSFDLHVMYGSAAQERVLNGIISKAFGMKKFIPYYNNPSEKFLMVHVNHFDYPDPLDEIGEKAYTYDVPDVFDYDEEDFTTIARINEIQVDIQTVEANVQLDVDGLPQPSNQTGKITITDTIKYE